MLEFLRQVIDRIYGGDLRSLFALWLIVTDFWGLLISKYYHLSKAISFFTVPAKRYHTLLFFSDRRSFRSTDCTIRQKQLDGNWQIRDCFLILGLGSQY
jgi:hypothetical protein